MLMLCFLSKPCSAQFQHYQNINDVGQYEPLYPTGVPHPPSDPFIEVKFDNHPSNGHFRLHIRTTLQSAASIGADGVLSIHLKLEDNTFDPNRIEFEFAVPVEAGANSAEASFLIPHGGGRSGYSVVPYWNGRLLKNGRVHLSFNNGNWNQSPSPSIKVFSENTLNVYSRTANPRFSQISQVSPQTLFAPGRWLHIDSGGSSFGNAEFLPVDWRELTAFSSIEILVEDFVKLTAQQIQALEKYVLAGGYLLVICDKEEVHSGLHVWSQSAISKDWSWITSGRHKTEKLPDLSFARSVAVSEVQGVFESWQLGLGVVRFGNEDNNSSILQNSAPPDTLFFDAGNSYWEWLIPNIGKTPVYLFMMLAVGFVCVVAPSIMVWANRHRRRIWTLILMPIAALLAVLCLLASAWMGSGNGNFERKRSLTILDSQGVGVSWARQTAFSSFTRDISVDNNTLFSFIDWRTYPENLSLQGAIGSEGVLYKRALPARTTTQVQQIVPVKTTPLLEIQELEDGTVKVSSLIQSTIRGGAVTNGSGQLFLLRELQPGQAVTLTSSSTLEVSNWLSVLNDTEPLVLPQGIPNSSSRYYSGYYNLPTKGPAGEKYWSELIGSTVHGTKSLLQELAVVAPRKYIVFTQANGLVKPLISEVSETGSIHLWLGAW